MKERSYTKKEAIEILGDDLKGFSLLVDITGKRINAKGEVRPTIAGVLLTFIKNKEPNFKEIISGLYKNKVIVEGYYAANTKRAAKIEAGENSASIYPNSRAYLRERTRAYLSYLFAPSPRENTFYGLSPIIINSEGRYILTGKILTVK